MRLPDTKEIEINSDGVLLRRIYVPFNQRRFFCFMPKLFRIIEGADVIQWNSFVSAITGGVISKMKNKPHVLLTHELFRDLWKKFSDNIIERNLYPFMEKIIVRNNYDAGIVPCDYTKRTLVKMGMPSDKIMKIPHGIDLKLFQPKYGLLKEKYDLFDRFVVGWTGRMDFSGTAYSKNLKCLFDAFKKVKTKVPSSVLLLGGVGFENISWYLEELGLEIGKDVIYSGRLPYKDLPFFYSSCDVFASSSLSEGFGFTVVESQACGTPVVAFEGAGSLDEVIAKNKSGKLVSPQTFPALAKGILELHKYPKLREDMSRVGMQWVKQFNWKDSAKMHEKVYEDVYCHHKMTK